MGVNKTDDAYEVALEWLKQIITLSSGFIVLSATFISSVFKQLNWSIWFLIGSWLSFLVSIIFSLETISVITQSRIDSNKEWSMGRGKTYAKVAKWFFISGILIFIIFTIFNFLTSISKPKTIYYSLYGI